MPDTTSSLLQLLLMADGLHNSDWGDQTNTNLSKLEAAICGATSKDISAAGTITLTDDESRALFLTFSGSPASDTTVALPARTKRWILSNTTSVNVLVKLTGGSVAFSLPPGTSLYDALSDGTNLQAAAGGIVGEVTDYAGVELPSSNYMWPTGQAISRSAFASLFNALTKTCVVTGTSGQSVLTVTSDLRNKGLVGAVIEGTGIATSTHVTAITSNQLTLDKPLTGSPSGGAARIFPYGNGDGSTSFNLPDLREVVTVARGDMGGATSPGRITTASTTYPASLNQIFGVETVSLTSGQNGPHAHGVNDPTHSHSVNDPTHSHSLSGFRSDGPISYGNTIQVWRNATGSINTDNSGTGIYLSAASTGISLQTSGSGAAHSNTQPTFIINKKIRVL